MPEPVENKTLLCEQCGAPLHSRDGEIDCLHCLLTAGIESGTGEAGSPNESATRFYQHYEILTRPNGLSWELGRGAMGTTYKAHDRNLDTPVALKIINARFSARPDARQRFLREAQAAARLRHPNVASVFHFGTINTLPDPEGKPLSAEENAEAGDCFYAMEFIEGETLEARLRRTGPLPPLLALQVAMQVTRALAAAEKRGLVHRDLKPSNIMLAMEEENSAIRGEPGESWVKVIDFGLAKFDREEPIGGAKFSGTVAFSSPEQIEGREVDGRADIYSLGVTLWYSLTGNVPSTGSGEGTPLPATQLAERGVPPPVIALLESMLAPNPQDRPASAVALAEVLQRCLENLASDRQPRSGLLAGHRWRAWAAALGLAAVLIAGAIYFLSARPPSEDKSIAVLPLKNLSHDTGDAFFAEGLEDDILSRLIKIRDLKVISRLSSLRYPADAPRNLPEIGRSLGVRHVLQGSLRRQGNRVLLNVALIDTLNGHELWAERYDRTLADAITLQGELANAIADALDARLSPQEKIDVHDKSTRNPDAYVLYLRGRRFDNSPTFAISDNEAAQALYSQAIALDPSFALAHARRGAVLAFLYRFRGPSDELRDNAYAEVEEALRLRPDLGEAHLAKGLCLYRIDRDFDRPCQSWKTRAGFCLTTLRRIVSSLIFIAAAANGIKRARGWNESFRAIRAMSPTRKSFTPRAIFCATGLTRPSISARRKRSRQRRTLLAVEGALVDLWRDGNLAPLHKVFAGIKSFGDPEGSLAWMRWDAALLERDFPAAEEAIDMFPFETLPSVFGAPVPKSYLKGCIALASGDRAQAQELFEISRPVLEAEALAHPESELRHARLGVLYAYMGRKAEAIREGKRAIELKPVASDAYDGPEQLCMMALIYAWVGEPDQAIAIIRKQLPAPAGVFFYEASMSWWELRLRWEWDPLRKDPRFQEIVAHPEPPTIY